MNPRRRLRLALAMLLAVMIVGTAGYVLLGFGWLDALYQTVTTVTTVGFREVKDLTPTGKVFTIVLILFGVGTALYTLGVLIEALVEGQLSDVLGRRKLEKQIEAMRGHVIICGWGRVGRAMAPFLAGAGYDVVVVDNDPELLAGIPYVFIVGDATDDAVLERAGIHRARALVAAVSSDADNLYITLSGRSLEPNLFIVARARIASSEEKLRRAGASRVVNPQAIGGARMAAFVMQPNVAEFLDVVMHDGSLEFRLEEVPVPQQSALVGKSLRQAQIRDRTGALVLALRAADGSFVTNPSPETVIEPGHILIAIGTEPQLQALQGAAAVP
jgi:voltage-gated potassium channel